MTNIHNSKHYGLGEFKKNWNFSQSKAHGIWYMPLAHQDKIAKVAIPFYDTDDNKMKEK